MSKIVITYGGHTYELSDLKFTLPELAAVQRHTGLLAVEFEAGIQDPKGNALALMGVLWLARRRAGDLIKWPEFEASLTEPLESMQFETLLDDQPVPNRADRRAATKK